MRTLHHIGTPKHNMGMAELVDQAVSEAKVYQEHGLDGVIVENMHDTPYTRGGVGPEITACMTRVCAEVRQAIGGNISLGVQVLSGEISPLSFLPPLSFPSSQSSFGFPLPTSSTLSSPSLLHQLP